MKVKPKHLHALHFVRKFWKDVIAATKVDGKSIYPLNYEKLREYATLGCNLVINESPSLTTTLVEQFLKENGFVKPSQPVFRGTELLFGFIYGVEGYGVIFIGYDTIVPRKLFTLAHEIGHFYRHHLGPYQSSLYAEESLFPIATSKRTGVFARKEINPETPVLAIPSAERKMEVEANAFAAELLMPVDEIRMLISRYRIRSKEKLHETMVEYFNVSRRATEIRISELSF